MAKKPRQVEYTDPEGQVQVGWYSDGHVYRDEAATQPLLPGSTFRADNGRIYEMTEYGGVLRSSPKQEDESGAWIPQGNQWYRAAADVTKELSAREPFAYDPGSDPLYAAARDQAQLQGSRAMQDTMGKAAALTGGYGSTYAQAAGQQAYALELAKLSDLLPELYDRAKDGYDAETERLLAQLGELTGLYDRDYQTYLDKVSAQNAERELQQRLESEALDRTLEQERYEKDLALQREKLAQDRELQEQKLRQEDARLRQEQELQQQKLTQEQTAQQQKQETDRQDKLTAQQKEERDRAFSLAMQGLTLGLTVPDALLAQAGIDPAYAERIRRYYAAQGS